MMTGEKEPLMVTIQCFTFNQEQYIRDCLDGFVMQKTDFRFEAIVHDDASTDSTADIIREYSAKYPDIIKPVIEVENQYSKKDGSLYRIMDNYTCGKYVAVCEGDDYWTDPLKLQKQFDLMEANPEYSLCFHGNSNLMPSGNLIDKRPTSVKPRYDITDVILGGGGFMATNSMFYRTVYLKKEERPAFWRNCPVGDLPTMLYYATKGSFGYIDEIMSVYRVQAQGSWSTMQNTFDLRSAHYKAILAMFREFDEYTKYEYHQAIKKKMLINKNSYYKDILHTICMNMLSRMKLI